MQHKVVGSLCVFLRIIIFEQCFEQCSVLEISLNFSKFTDFLFK